MYIERNIATQTSPLFTPVPAPRTRRATCDWSQGSRNEAIVSAVTVVMFLLTGLLMTGTLAAKLA